MRGYQRKQAATAGRTLPREAEGDEARQRREREQRVGGARRQPTARELVQVHAQRAQRLRAGGLRRRAVSMRMRARMRAQQ